mmetsp:Transcript_26935/g.70829  ORF Transcript_26935/g.70829 Transcript_26935/m.70829 type:complete len:488 (-) Transcript_26935:213-1676(-)
MSPLRHSCGTHLLLHVLPQLAQRCIIGSLLLRRILLRVDAFQYAVDCSKVGKIVHVFMVRGDLRLSGADGVRNACVRDEHDLTDARYLHILRKEQRATATEEQRHRSRTALEAGDADLDHLHKLGDARRHLRLVKAVHSRGVCTWDGLTGQMSSSASYVRGGDGALGVVRSAEDEALLHKLCTHGLWANGDLRTMEVDDGAAPEGKTLGHRNAALQPNTADHILERADAREPSLVNDSANVSGGATDVANEDLVHVGVLVNQVAFAQQHRATHRVRWTRTDEADRELCCAIQVRARAVVLGEKDEGNVAESAFEGRLETRADRARERLERSVEDRSVFPHEKILSATVPRHGYVNKSLAAGKDITNDLGDTILLRATLRREEADDGDTADASGKNLFGGLLNLLVVEWGKLAACGREASRDDVVSPIDAMCELGRQCLKRFNGRDTTATEADDSHLGEGRGAFCESVHKLCSPNKTVTQVGVALPAT